MYKKRLFPKLFGALLALTLTFSSCIGTTKFIPGKSSPPQDSTYDGYSLVELDSKVQPEQTLTLAQLSSSFSNSGNTLTGNYLQASGLTDSNGVIAFSDPTIGLAVPVILIDENDNPITGIQVRYLTNGDLILISINDPNQRFAPDWITVEKKDLIVATTNLPDNNFVGANYWGGVKIAKAIAPILGIIIIAVAFYGLIDMVGTGIEINKNPIQITKLSDIDVYECKTPERIGLESEFFLSFFYSIIPVGGGEKMQLLAEGGETLTSKAVGNGIANSRETPVLYHKYYINPDTLEMIIAGEGIDTTQIPKNSALIYEEIGNCAYVPSLENLYLYEATELLESRSLNYEIEYVDQFGNSNFSPNILNNDTLIVLEQSPKPTEIFYYTEINSIEIETMLPIGDYSGLNNKVTLTVQIIPATPTPTETPIPTSTPTRKPTKTSTPKPAYPTLYADQNYVCREGPGKAYDHVADIYEGTTHRIIGRASNGWVAISIDYSYTSHKYCWIGGGIVYGDLNSVKYYEVQESGTLPIYNFNTFKVIGYMSCSDAASYQWHTDACNGESGGCWISNTPLFGENYAGFFRHDGRTICGWNLP